MRFKGKVAIVTGGSSGIGKEAAKGLVAHGASVVLGGRDEEKLHAAAKEVSEDPGAVRVLAGDIGKPATGAALVDLTEKEFAGVISTCVGYTGGEVANATYRNHEGHAEAIEIIFDPDQQTYRKILEFFFQIHDPTTPDSQGNDYGSSYRSAIFYTSEGQKQIAEKTIADIDAPGIWPGKVVTEVSPAATFWQAEPEHQDYLERHPNGYTCHYPSEVEGRHSSPDRITLRRLGESLSEH